MSDKRTRQEYDWRKELSKHGWNVHKRDGIAWNSGSETLRHFVCKAIVAHYLKHEKGLRVDSEVAHAERGEIDVIAYGGDGNPIAVECETSPTEEIVSDKLSRYYDGTPFREVFVLNVNNMPLDIMDAYEWVHEQL